MIIIIIYLSRYWILTASKKPYRKVYLIELTKVIIKSLKKNFFVVDF